jgi:uncharacterized protein YbjT (DUF2867 family)
MKILVTCPTGNIGRRVLAELLAPEFSVRVIARDPSRLPQVIREQVEIVRGSTDDFSTLRRALDDVEALFWCVPPASLHEVNVRAHFERFAFSASQAVRETGIPRVVTISADGNVAGHSAGPISGLRAMETILNQSGAAIRHLRCGWLMENILRQANGICQYGVLSYPIPGHIPVPMTAANNIADVALRWLVRRDWSGIKGIAVPGPEALSLSQAAAILEGVLGRPVRYSEISADDYVRNLVRSGASVHYARGEAAMFSALAQGSSPAKPGTAEGAAVTTLAVWTQSELLPLLCVASPQPEPEATAVGIAKDQSEVSLNWHEPFPPPFNLPRNGSIVQQITERSSCWG